MPLENRSLRFTSQISCEPTDAGVQRLRPKQWRLVLAGAPLLSPMIFKPSELAAQTSPPPSLEARHVHRNLSHEALDQIFNDPQAGWSRIHAAEALSAVGFADDIRACVLTTLTEWERSPQRIGAWRVLVATTRDSAERQKWVDRIAGVAREVAAPDRLQAVETLGKIGAIPSANTLISAREYASLLPAAEALFPFWALTVAGDQVAAARLHSALSDSDAQVRRRAGYIIRRLPIVSPQLREALAKQVAQEPKDTAARPYLLTAAITLNLQPERHTEWLSELERLWPNVSGAVRLEISHALRKQATQEHLAFWREQIRSTDISTRVAAAWSTLEIASRRERSQKD
jgi:hypothetical protein